MKKLLLIIFCFISYLGINAQPPGGGTSGLSIVLQPNGLAGKDAPVFSNNATRNYGSAGNLVIYTWTNSGTLGIKRSYLEFDLSLIPPNSVVDSAYLELFFAVNPSEGFNTHSGSTDMFVSRVSNAWIESTINWNNKPSIDTVNQVSVLAHTNATQDYRIDVSKLVNDMLSIANHGFELRMQNETNAYRGLQFASSDYSNASKRPKLSVYYSAPTGLSKSTVLSKGINVYPNPSDDAFFIRLDNSLNLKELRIELRDISGKLIDVPLNYETASIDLQNMPKGIYLLRFIDEEGGTTSKKLILK